jgi:hypothetical protein
MPTSASGCWRVATGVTGETCVYLCVRNCPGAGEGWGEGEELPVSIEAFMEHPGLFPRFRDHTLRKFLPKLKMMDKDIDLALYRNLCRSLSITISRDCFNVKKHHTLYLDFSKGLR